MIQTTLKPVTLFSSKDNGAPQLTAAAGSLKTVLKACLTSGYGSKQALDWEMPFETVTDAVFKSKSGESNQHYLSIKNDGQRFAALSTYLEMSNIDNGKGLFSYSNDYKKFGYLSNTGNDTPRWWLIGHDKAFTLIISTTYSSYLDNCVQVMFFGDVPSLIPNDTGNTFFIASNGYHPYFEPNPWRFLGINDGNFGRLARKWNISGISASTQLHSLGGVSESKAEYPDVITGGTMASEIYIYEQTANDRWNMRCLLPGWFKAHNQMNNIADGEQVVIDGTHDVFLKFCFDYRADGHYLLNVSNWEQ